MRLQTALTAIILGVSFHCYSLDCIDSELVWPKTVITMYLESEYPNTEELLGKFAHAKPSGESEFYRAAMLYRMGEFEKSKSAIDRSLDKEFYMASIFAGIAYQLGLEGYSKDNVESQSYFRKFESWKKHCNEEYISDSNFELAYETVAKVFGLAHTSLVLPAPLNQ